MQKLDENGPSPGGTGTVLLVNGVAASSLELVNLSIGDLLFRRDARITD